jgi:carboxylesterase
MGGFHQAKEGRNDIGEISNGAGKKTKYILALKRSMKTIEGKDINNNPIWLEGSSEIGVLLFHGWTALPEEFSELAHHLHRKGYWVSVPLLRGHGTKPEDLKDVMRADWIWDAKNDLDQLRKKCKKIIVGGISMGGDLALLLSEENRVAGVILLAAPIKFKFHSMAKIALYFMGLNKVYRKKYFPKKIRKKMPKRQVYSYYPIRNVKEVIRLADTARRSLSRVTKPVLVMQSTTDHMLPKRTPQQIISKIKSDVREIYWIRDAYHVFSKDKKVHEKISEFISRIIS